MPLLLLLGWPLPVQGRLLTGLDELLPVPWTEAALRLVQRQAAALGAPAARLQLRRQQSLPGGAVIAFGQVHRGLPVLGGEAVLHLRCAGGAPAPCRAVALAGRLHRLEGPPDGSFGGLLPRSALAAALRRVLPGAHLQSARLAFWPGPHQAGPVWQVRALTRSPFALLEVFLSATTGERLWQRPALRSVKGRVYPVSPALGSVEDRNLLGLLAVDRLQGSHADAQACRLNSTALVCSRQARPDAAGDYLIDPEDPSFDDGFAEVHGYYHADSFHRWLAQRFGFARQSGKAIQVIVNFGYDQAGQTSDYPNAFYGDLDGDELGDLVFGQSRIDFAYDAEVIYHEFTHSVVEETSGLDAGLDELGSNMMPLGLNEGFADLMSCSYTDDPVLAEYASQSSAGLRDLRGSSSCPDHLTGESHGDGQIWGQALWSLRQQAGDRALFETLAYQCLIGLPSSSGMDEAAALLLKLIHTSFPSFYPAATLELAGRGLLGCSRLVPLLPEKSRQVYILGAWTLGLKQVPAPLQHRVEVPAHATELRVRFRRQPTGSVLAYYRRGEPITYQGHTILRDGEKLASSSELVLSVGDAERPLQPGASYYFLAFNTSGMAVEVTITASLALAELPPDAGPPDAGPGDQLAADRLVSAELAGESPPSGGGCSCRLAAAGGPGLPGLALVTGLLLLVRRRRTRREQR